MSSVAINSQSDVLKLFDDLIHLWTEQSSPFESNGWIINIYNLVWAWNFITKT